MRSPARGHEHPVLLALHPHAGWVMRAFSLALAAAPCPVGSVALPLDESSCISLGFSQVLACLASPHGTADLFEDRWRNKTLEEPAITALRR